MSCSVLSTPKTRSSAQLWLAIPFALLTPPIEFPLLANYTIGESHSVNCWGVAATGRKLDFVAGQLFSRPPPSAADRAGFRRLS
jgi:hypothetical protein